MKSSTQYKIFGVKGISFLLGTVFLLAMQEMQGQYISNTGAYVSITSGTAVGVTTINNDSASTLVNQGTVTLYTLNNSGITQGDGTFNIAGDFTNTGTFFSGNGTVNMNGTLAQTLAGSLSTFNNLIIDNAAGVLLNSTQTVTNNLTINSGKVFKVEADKKLEVKGTISNLGGTSGFILKSTAVGTASLIHNTDNVPATVQRYISGVKEDWHFLSTPVSNQNISGDWTPTGSYGNATGYDLYIWDEATPCWTYQLNTTVAPTWPSLHPTSSFVKGRGYLYSTQALNPTKEFSGLLNNGDVNFSVTKIGPDQGVGQDDVRGFNLIGNPYPSAVDWKATSGWTRTNLLNSSGGYDMWIWNPATKNYGVFNSLGTTGTNGVTQNIASMQGFFVRAETNGTIGMRNAIRGNTGASNWMKMKTTKTDLVKVQIVSAESYGSDEVLLQFGAPLNVPGAAKLFSTITTAPSLYLNQGKEKLSVLNLTSVNENPSIPLLFKAGKDGNYAVSIASERANFDTLLLEDKKTKIVTDLNSNPTYQFHATVKDATDRFVIHFSPIIEEAVHLPAVIYYDGNTINVDLTLVKTQTDIKVYDMLGKLLIDKKAEGNRVHSFTMNSKNGVYIVIANSNGKVLSRKVVVY